RLKSRATAADMRGCGPPAQALKTNRGKSPWPQSGRTCDGPMTCAAAVRVCWISSPPLQVVTAAKRPDLQRPRDMCGCGSSAPDPRVQPSQVVAALAADL